MQIAFVLNVIIAILLVLTIIYAMRLNQRLAQLRNDKNELMALAKTFAEATTKADEGIKTLRVSSEALQEDLQKAQTLRDDLAYLIERGGRSADEMMTTTVRAPKDLSARAKDLSARAKDLSAREREVPRKREGQKRIPRGAQNFANEVSEDDNQLIQDAIRASMAQGRQSASQSRSSEPRPSGPRRSRSHPLDALGGRADAPQKGGDLGGGLGGMSGEDRLFDQARSLGGGGSANAKETANAGDDLGDLGDTDAARELLKALSSMK